ncbi:MAG: GGDEF domain-containing protein [Elusimicrobia bacterium]|nr:GGDEF domain-containing protein [Elusimicrobiota bacterium]
MGRSLSAQLKSARAQLYRERLENRRRNELFSAAIRTNDLREVGAQLYRYFFEYFDVNRGDITILTDYDEREFYDRVGWMPRRRLPSISWYRGQAEKHSAYLRGLVEEQVFVGYTAENERIIRESLFIEASMLECMVTKRPRIVNNVVRELSMEEIAQARHQDTSSWMNWVILHPDSGKVLAKMHMSFVRPRQPALKELTRRLLPFSDLLRYRILHTRDYRRAKYLSERDVLTGFYLRPILAERWERFLEGSGRGRGNAVISIAMLDLDHFKRFNDHYGHDVGDAVLKRFAQAVQATVRGSDVVGRYGGEEFVALFPGANSEAVRSILRRVNGRLKDEDFIPVSARLRGAAAERLRFSAGIFTVRPGRSGLPPTFDAAIKSADDLLLVCKASGRNCCANRGRSGALRKYRFD